MTKLVWDDTPDPSIIFTDEFMRTMNLMEQTSNHIFLTGKAGVGKSTLLREWCRTTHKNYGIVAPTGIAAINAKGSTIHSYLNIKPGMFVEEAKHNMPRRDLSELDTLVIDEMSMVRADLLDIIAEILTNYGPVPGIPFGGVQLVMIGDLCQLPPIVTTSERSIFNGKVYDSPYFFSAKIWDRTDFTPIELTQVFRQSDPLFISILNQVRSGALSRGYTAALKTRCARDWQDGQLKLVSRNAIMQTINEEEMAKLPTETHTLIADTDGEFKAKDAPNDINLRLKVGARVMFLVNDSKLRGSRWVNGDFGTIAEIQPDPHYPLITVTHDNGLDCDVLPHQWNITENYYDEALQRTNRLVKGTFSQFPLRPAWAITIHKSQGQTFNNVCIDLKGIFAPGQSYVALSRCRSMEGLSLINFEYVRKLYPEPVILQFYNKIARRMNEAFKENE